MITAVDTSVLLDVFGGDPSLGPASSDAVRRCLLQGRLVACDIVWAEVAGAFPTSGAVSAAMKRLCVEFSPTSEHASVVAGKVWKDYRARGGKRERMVPDFLIGAHASEAADRLLSRDRGFYKTFFSKLRLIDPSARARRRLNH